jgi:hypothetical protein
MSSSELQHEFADCIDRIVAPVLLRYGLSTRVRSPFREAFSSEVLTVVLLYNERSSQIEGFCGAPERRLQCDLETIAKVLREDVDQQKLSAQVGTSSGIELVLTRFCDVLQRIREKFLTAEPRQVQKVLAAAEERSVRDAR